MKSYCKSLAIDEGMVSDALDDWLRHTSGHKNRWRVEEEFGSAMSLVGEIATEIRERRLKLRPMRSYQHIDGPRGKERTITVESVKQQVCDYLAVHAITPMLNARLGFWQYGSAHVRNNIELAHAVKGWEHDSAYWVHLDVRKCYQSIGTGMLKRMLHKYIRSSDVRYLLDVLLDMHGWALTLGSFLSLRLAQWVLSFGYHYVESLHKERRGKNVALVSHQCWYMDDIWLFSRRKRDLQAAARMLEAFLSREFGLRLHTWQVCTVGNDEPVDVAGYIVRPDRITIRSCAFLRAFRSLRRYRRGPTLKRARSLVSHKGQWTHTDSAGFAARHDALGTVRSAQAYISRHERLAAA